MSTPNKPEPAGVEPKNPAELQDNELDKVSGGGVTTGFCDGSVRTDIFSGQGGGSGFGSGPVATDGGITAGRTGRT